MSLDFSPIHSGTQQTHIFVLESQLNRSARVRSSPWGDCQRLERAKLMLFEGAQFQWKQHEDLRQGLDVGVFGNMACVPKEENPPQMRPINCVSVLEGTFVSLI